MPIGHKYFHPDFHRAASAAGDLRLNVLKLSSYSGNDYLITVKGNQPKLFEQLKAQFEQPAPQIIEQQSE